MKQSLSLSFKLTKVDFEKRVAFNNLMFIYRVSLNTVLNQKHSYVAQLSR